ncbi:MAG: hypothetical protein QOG73_1266 [Acetobacteraceae bacterium]|jgi:hypothetical protein|nr:hypothetical protein [Acetobacteraceae bacterium]
MIAMVGNPGSKSIRGPMPSIAAVALASLLVLISWPTAGEMNSVVLPLNDAATVRAHNVTVRSVSYAGSDALQVRLTGAYRGPDTDTFAYVPGVDFHDGTIDVDVAGFPLPDAPSGARGFVGIAFRIDVEGGSYACEGLYVRPTNGRAQDQLRRNHSTQYFSYPDYDFDRLRRETPGRYESYSDLVPGEWTHLRIDVSGSTALLYVGGATQPALIVHDLKRGPDAHGAVGLYVDSGTDGHFRNLSIQSR